MIDTTEIGNSGKEFFIGATVGFSLGVASEYINPAKILIRHESNLLLGIRVSLETTLYYIVGNVLPKEFVFNLTPIRIFGGVLGFAAGKIMRQYLLKNPGIIDDIKSNIISNSKFRF